MFFFTKASFFQLILGSSLAFGDFRSFLAIKKQLSAKNTKKRKQKKKKNWHFFCNIGRTRQPYSCVPMLTRSFFPQVYTYFLVDFTLLLGVCSLGTLEIITLNGCRRYETDKNARNLAKSVCALTIANHKMYLIMIFFFLIKKKTRACGFLRSSWSLQADIDVDM